MSEKIKEIVLSSLQEKSEEIMLSSSQEKPAETIDYTIEEVIANVDIVLNLADNIISSSEKEMITKLFELFKSINDNNQGNKSKSIDTPIFLALFKKLSDKGQECFKGPYLKLSKIYLLGKIENNLINGMHGYDNNCIIYLKELFELFPDYDLSLIKDKLNKQQNDLLDVYIKDISKKDS